MQRLNTVPTQRLDNVTQSSRGCLLALNWGITLCERMLLFHADKLNKNEVPNLVNAVASSCDQSAINCA